MTTVEQEGARSLLDGAISHPAAVSGRRRVARWMWRYRGRIRNVAVMLTATGCCTAAAFMWQPWAGLVATGVAVVLVDFAADDRQRGPQLPE